MDISELKAIPIAEFLQRLGHTPTAKRGHEWTYFAPYRQEHKPSFRLNTEKNLFYDFGTGVGGDIFTLAGEIIGTSDFKQQAKYIADNADVQMPMVEHPVFRSIPDEPVFEDVEVRELTNRFLLGYLKSRGISEENAKAHCDEIGYYLHGKPYYAVGFPNISGGFEIRNKFFKGCIPPKDVSLVAGNPAICCIYEGFIDCLSAIQLGEQREETALVLNSVSNIHRAYRHLDSFATIRCYLDNDEAGRNALGKLRDRYGDRISDRSTLYAGYNDVNDYLQSFQLKKTTKSKLKL